ncbi:DUF5518 domain-containing protein [Methanobacterium aggregans]|uniref:DUF5518 domain-containing protein n=1 Tax=Methanobacterium aggregans TaxID=1615586 RepID=UPI001FD9ED70|nr:DUF5518 domain-containing protein [Methanobacterium aggregans]MBP2045229.1 hypothetical protein [Methanobacterium aggregans]
MIKINLKIIGVGALVNAALTIILSRIFFPLLVLGPLTGGFLSSYHSRGYEDYDKMDKKDGMVVGAISGLIGGLITGLLFILGIGDITSILGVISTGNTLLNAYIIIQLSLIMSFVLGLVGGFLGVIVKK